MKTLNVEMATFSFGPFTLIPGRQLLAKGSKPVRVGLRCFDILLALVERAGEVVAKEELMSRAWPDTFVEEGNLKVNVAALRRVLGDNSAEPQYVATVNGRRTGRPQRTNGRELKQSVRVACSRFCRTN